MNRLKVLVLCLLLSGCADWTPEQAATFQQGLMNANMVWRTNNPPAPRPMMMTCSGSGNFVNCQSY